MPGVVEFDCIDELPSYESLQLVRRVDQLCFPEKSPVLHWTLIELQDFLKEYHTCHRVTAFLKQKDIPLPPQHFGKLLPRVRYQRTRPCQYCGTHTYLRSVTTHSDIFHKNSGSLNCTGCDAWIVLSKGQSYGNEYSLQHSSAKTNSDNSKSVNKSFDIEFLEAILQRYVPEYHHASLRSYFAGSLSLASVQERTGIYLSSDSEGYWK